ncbi:MAG TPA: DUF2306 domain-containing protein [Allosphingosinicella sp.]|jgi:uncharacterized membrane protein|nr:DUF2306 domain-containing protein [Allosphingosinicella sp.]
MIRSPIYSAAWRSVVLLLTVEIAIVSALRYFIGSQTPPPPILANPFADPFLILHVAGSVTALLVAPVQLVGRLRARPAFHRAAGRIYVLACAIGAPSGFILALGSTAGSVAGAGFAVQAFLWGAFTWLGYRAAVEGRFPDHREWMLRSYAATSSAITFRLMLPASAFLGLDFLATYRVIAWLAWMVNLALFEYHIRRGRGRRATYDRLASA